VTRYYDVSLVEVDRPEDRTTDRFSDELTAKKKLVEQIKRWMEPTPETPVTTIREGNLTRVVGGNGHFEVWVEEHDVPDDIADEVEELPVLEKAA
jgi:hypothetical protein